MAINSPRGFGKSVFSAVTSDEFAIHFPYTKIALFSTSQDQANDLMDKVRYLLKHSIFAYMVDKKHDSKTEMWLSNGSQIKAFPQSEVTIRGYHPHIKIIDEKARMKREILESAIRPMGRKVCWLEIGISTPFGMNNNHYEDCSNPQVFKVMLLKPTDVSWVDQKKLAQEVQMMGDRIARQELYAEFLEDADTVFKPLWIEHMLHLQLQQQPNGFPSHHYMLGIDWGKQRDYTAFCILHKEPNGTLIIDRLERYLQIDYQLAIDKAYDLANRFNISLVVPDGTGVGVSVMEQLVRKMHSPIYRSKIKKKDKSGKDIFRDGFVFTNVSKLNLVDETVRQMMNSNIKCPHHFNTSDPMNERYIYKVLENEMIQFTYSRTSSGNVIFGHPEDNKSHDDVLTAVMLAVWGYKFDTGAGIKMGGAPTYRTVQGDKIIRRMN